MIVKIDNLGRIVIPYQIRREMGVKSGDILSLSLMLDDMGGVVIRSVRKDTSGVKAMLDKVIANASSGVKEQLILSTRDILRLMELDNK